MKVTESAIVDGGDKRSSILRAAAQVFAERGYEAAAVEAIAEHARIAKGTVYLYFRSKEELFFRVCDDYIVEIERIGNQATKASSMRAASRIQESIHTLLALSTEARSMFLLSWSSGRFPPRRSATNEWPPHFVMPIPNSGG